MHRSDTSSPPRSLLRRSLGALVLVVMAAIAGGCGAGYSVIRADESVSFEAARWQIHTTTVEGEGLDVASFDRGFETGLAELAEGFSFERSDAVTGPYALRVRLDAPTQGDAATWIRGNVAIEDPSGNVVDEIRIELRDTTTDASTLAASAGAEFGRRTMHYIHNHERHHY